MSACMSKAWLLLPLALHALCFCGSAPRTVRRAQELSQERSEEMLVALGRNLWAAAEELLEVSAMLSAYGSPLELRKFSPQGLGAAALALRNAADMMLDDDWESAMGELEAAESDEMRAWLPRWRLRRVKASYRPATCRVWWISSPTRRLRARAA